MSNSGRLPNFIVIGAAKRGTTSLHYYLSLHPEIFMSRVKEARFFGDERDSIGRWNRGLDWYNSLFQTTLPICGESSPAYTTWPDAETHQEKGSTR
jgi:hypothetical protein